MMAQEERFILSEKQITKKEKRELIEAVQKAIADMEITGSHVDFQTVSRKMGIARSTLYRNQVARETISAARQKNKLPPNTLDNLQAQIYELQEKVYDLETRLKVLESSSDPLPDTH